MSKVSDSLFDVDLWEIGEMARYDNYLEVSESENSNCPCDFGICSECNITERS